MCVEAFLSAVCKEAKAKQRQLIDERIRPLILRGCNTTTLRVDAETVGAAPAASEGLICPPAEQDSHLSAADAAPDFISCSCGSSLDSVDGDDEDEDEVAGAMPPSFITTSSGPEEDPSWGLFSSHQKYKQTKGGQSMERSLRMMNGGGGGSMEPSLSPLSLLSPCWSVLMSALL